jgi:Mrp family chromosome partitioning ATPase
VEVIAFGKIPEGPIDDKRKPAALGAAVFATLGTLMLTIISTMLAGRLRFSDDMDARGESLLAAVVPDVEPPGEALAAAAVELRNEIDLRWPRQGTGAMVLGVVGASTGAGATSLAGALGMHYAGTGRRVILAEVDAASGAYRDAVQSDSPGVAAVARGDAALEDALQELPSEQGFLSLLPASPRGQAALRRSGVAELALDDMQNLLQSARAEADVIILDLGVLTAGRQSAVGAALSDRVLLVSSSGDRSSDLSGALDLLERLAPERALLAFNRASHLDPAIAASAAREPAVSFGAA